MSGSPPDPNDPSRQGQYPPPRQWSTTQPEHSYPPMHYPPASQWNVPEHHPVPHYPPPQYPYPPGSYPPASYPPVSYPPTSYPPSSYPPPPGPEQHYQQPPHAPYHMPPGMNHMHPPPPQDPYRLPPAAPGYRPDAYSQPPAPPGPVYPQAAPRQRTAIACGYCRRRKIRCSGFENSHDGRCSNCIRFNQQCLFTPVSSQAQAFVPAHAAYPHLRNPQNRQRPGVVLYGAQGQPLPPTQQQPHPGAEGTLPPPQGMYPAYSRPPHVDGSTPPLAPIQDPRINGRRGSGSSYEYPDPTNLAPVSPASTATYQAQTPGSYYQPPPLSDVRPPPQYPYPYDGRHSSSPHSSPYPPIKSEGTPPPGSLANSVNGSRGGLNVRDMLNPGDQNREPAADQPRPSSTDQTDGRASVDQSQGRSSDQNQGRSSTDSDMLNALNRRGLNR